MTPAKVRSGSRLRLCRRPLRLGRPLSLERGRIAVGIAMRGRVRRAISDRPRSAASRRGLAGAVRRVCVPRKRARVSALARVEESSRKTSWDHVPRVQVYGIQTVTSRRLLSLAPVRPAALRRPLRVTPRAFAAAARTRPGRVDAFVSDTTPGEATGEVHSHSSNMEGIDPSTAASAEETRSPARHRARGRGDDRRPPRVAASGPEGSVETSRLRAGRGAVAAAPRDRPWR